MKPLFDLSAFRAREFERRRQNLAGAQPQKLVKRGKPGFPLHIVYVMTHTGVCGGTKIILEHANQLANHGIKVTLLSHFEKPEWFPIDQKVSFVRMPFETELTMGIPLCDVIVATYWREIYECILRRIAPVVYFEQGDYHLFDWENVSEREKAYILTQYATVPFVFTVSPGAAGAIEMVFKRKADVFPNAIDHSVFYPGIRKADERIRIATTGSEHNGFKRIEDIKTALRVLQERGYKTAFYWITPDEPSERCGRVAVNPPQPVIGEFCRNADYFVSASLYESFSLPVLEGMACGCCAITTENQGVLSYAQNGENCAFVRMNDPQNIADTIETLHHDVALRQKIIQGGLETARRFSWEAVIPKLIAYYRSVAGYRPA